VLRDVVRVDAHDGDAAPHIFARQGCQLIGHMNHEGAMVAHKHDQQRRSIGKIVTTDLPAVHVHQTEIGRLGAERRHRAGGANHGFFSAVLEVLAWAGGTRNQVS
jgi:hypothetical protein